MGEDYRFYLYNGRANETSFERAYSIQLSGIRNPVTTSGEIRGGLQTAPIS